jgi:hypothetical protein
VRTTGLLYAALAFVLASGCGKWPREAGRELDQAIWAEDMDRAQRLLAHGANPNARNRAGQTPLDRATRRGHRKVIEVLREHGARE